MIDYMQMNEVKKWTNMLPNLLNKQKKNEDKVEKGTKWQIYITNRNKLTNQFVINNDFKQKLTKN